MAKKHTVDSDYEKTLLEIGNRLMLLRLKKGYATIKDFASTHDLPLIQYWRIERGQTNFTFKSLNRLLVIHGITIEELFER